MKIYDYREMQPGTHLMYLGEPMLSLGMQINVRPKKKSGRTEELFVVPRFAAIRFFTSFSPQTTLMSIIESILPGFVLTETDMNR